MVFVLGALTAVHRRGYMYECHVGTMYKFRHRTSDFSSHESKSNHCSNITQHPYIVREAFVKMKRIEQNTIQFYFPCLVLTVGQNANASIFSLLLLTNDFTPLQTGCKAGILYPFVTCALRKNGEPNWRQHADSRWALKGFIWNFAITRRMYNEERINVAMTTSPHHSGNND